MTDTLIPDHDGITLEAIKRAEERKAFTDLRNNPEQNTGKQLVRQIGEGDLFAMVGQPGFSPLPDKFAGNQVGLTAEEHKRCVEAFLAGGPDSPNLEGAVPGCGKITRLDRGASSGLASIVQRQNIRFGKNPQPFRRD